MDVSESPAAKGQLVELEERRWLQRHVAGDSSAFAELVAAYRAPVYGYLVRSGLDTATRDDLFQDIFLKLHRAASSYQASRPFKPWLFTIVANTVRNHFRDRARDAVELSEATQATTPTTEPAPDRVAAARQTLGWLEEAIRELPLAQREVLILCTVEEMDQQSVAVALQIPVNTVKTHLRRARLELAKRLAKR